ncbi:DNA-binding NarL/FixJ family response regulator [Paenibacillus sp. LBL]|uniref:helix-turn-helix transcriptional regulator n=1 Tax=Paenibacillus sp. LBL TaxID=2940563 RepID=UPI002475D6FA|nr:LuxR C-terminal-related transcriptional regulator [Paenibacillus sp. LBL]MDH6674992.1 DNA-binding NarL/FixJ family response regulator [Paenibacillus sp. LBL]
MMDKRLECVESYKGFLLKGPSDLSMLNKINEMYLELKVRHSLTNREIEVLTVLTILGHSNTVLGALLNITENTLKNHIARIMDKTNTHSTRELQALTYREIIIPLLDKLLEKEKNKKKKKANSAS